MMAEKLKGAHRRTHARTTTTYTRAEAASSHRVLTCPAAGIPQLAVCLDIFDGIEAAPPRTSATGTSDPVDRLLSGNVHT